MKKSIPNFRERESEASILGNDREREFPLPPEGRGGGLPAFYLFLPKKSGILLFPQECGMAQEAGDVHR